MMEIVDNENTVNIFVPMQIKRRGGSAMVILPENPGLLYNKKNHDHRIITAIGKAYRWQQMLEKDGLTINAIAQMERVTPSYVGRMLRLNFLAPDIVKAILDGTQPKTLKLQDLLSKPVPTLWEDQVDLV